MTHRRGTTHHRRKVSWFLPLPATRTSGSFTSLTASLIAVSIYWCVSVLATLINKWLLSASEFKFPFPHTIALLQLIYAIVLLTVLKRLQIWSSPTAQWNSGAITMRRLWPLAATYALMLTANNMALKYLCLASYQMVRCASVGFVLVFTPFILNREALPLNIVAAVLSILSGSIVWMSETVFTGIGLLYALVTSVSIALYSLYARQILYTFDYPVIYVYYRCIIIAVMLIAMVVVTSGELVGVFNTYFIGSPGFWLITGILATQDL
ncbi:hypothetical protein BDF19DRAFT_59366 [Syncephalis fuscata]|nr:hypothetical protein BDF19DRAFT_59366 [Syncephalis fuscata]